MERRPTPEDFQLPPEGLPEVRRVATLELLDEYLAHQKANFLGYQADQQLEYQKELAKYLDCQLNNLGDPYKDGNFTLNTKMMERAVVDYYAQLWNAKPYNPDDPESTWGYVLSMGSSEAYTGCGTLGIISPGSTCLEKPKKMHCEQVFLKAPPGWTERLSFDALLNSVNPTLLVQCCSTLKTLIIPS